jgi:hypothetical protein
MSAIEILSCGSLDDFRNLCLATLDFSGKDYGDICRAAARLGRADVLLFLSQSGRVTLGDNEVSLSL